MLGDKFPDPVSPIAYHDHLLIPTLSRLARRGRPALLDDLAALTPWIIAYTERTSQPTALTELVRAITETAQCWP